MKKNLHFVTGRQVTDKDKKAAPPNSAFRSAAAYIEGDSVRECLSVSGAAPQAYRDAFDYIEAKVKPKPKEPATEQAAPPAAPARRAPTP